MSINMADVKQIMYGNKEVTKIEDGLGNILWQKQVGPTVDPYIYYIQNTYNYRLDMVNKTATQMTANGNLDKNGNKVFGFNGKWWIWVGSTKKTIALDPDNNTITFTGITNAWPTNSNYDSNLISHVSTATWHLKTNYNYWITGEGTGEEQTGTPWSRGNCIMKCDIVDGNNTYKYLGTPLEESTSSGTYLTAYDPDTGNRTTTDIPTYTGVRTRCWAMWHIGNRLLYDYAGDHKEFNFTTRTWENHTWNNLPSQFHSSRIFVWNNRIFMVGGTSTSTTIYELNPNTDTWSTYWTGLPTGMRGDSMFDKDGNLALLSCGNRRFDRTL